jgi:hypothetical protein
MRESMQHEAAVLVLYKEPLTAVERRESMLTQYARMYQNNLIMSRHLTIYLHRLGLELLPRLSPSLGS